MRIKFVRLCYLALYCVAHYVCRLAWYVIVLSYSVISGNSFTQYNLHTLIRSLETTKATQISEEKLRYKTAWIYFLNLLIFFRVEKRLDWVFKFLHQKVSFYRNFAVHIIGMQIDVMHNDVTRFDAREECWSL
jgi:hypothetical protein